VKIIDFTKLTFNVGDKFDIVSPTTINIGKYIISSISQKILELERQSDNEPTNSVVTNYQCLFQSGAQGFFTYTFTHKFTNIDFDKVLRLSKNTPFSGIGENYSSGDTIIINTSVINKGKYRIVGVNNVINNVYLDLRRLSDDSATDNVSTSYQFTLNPLVNPFISYTNDGFTNVKNVIAPDKFANLRYSIKRNIEKYWRNYLTTCNLYKRVQPIKNTIYKNNKFFSSSYDGLSLVESHDIATSFEPPILTPFIYNDVVFANVEFNDFIALQNAVRTDRGYIKTYDNNGLPIELYPISMKYENLTKELTIKAEEKFVSRFAPTLQTVLTSPSSGTTELSGGTILSNGYSDITSKGVVWSTNANPTVNLSTKTNEGTGYDSFTSLMSPLIQFTDYYARAYATNEVGVGYGSQINFVGGVTDVVIGTQTWMVENLDVVKYRNGDTIPQHTGTNSEWALLTEGAWCWYSHLSSNGLIYGKLYNWYAVNDSRGLAPLGYHVPTNAEWTTLTNYLGGQYIAGEKMKSTTLWNSTLYATNSSGLTAFPAGYRSGSFFSGLGSVCCWWTSESVNASSAYYIEINIDGTEVSPPISGSKAYGFSVRLIKD